jgi:hypothetical protein
MAVKEFEGRTWYSQECGMCRGSGIARYGIPNPDWVPPEDGPFKNMAPAVWRNGVCPDCDGEGVIWIEQDDDYDVYGFYR